MVKCPKCCELNRDESSFCGNCGAGLLEPVSQSPFGGSGKCPRCGNSADDLDKFCSFCGGSLKSDEHHQKSEPNSEVFKTKDIWPPSQPVKPGQEKESAPNPEKYCPECGSVTEAESLFCPNCGYSYKLKKRRIPVPPPSVPNAHKQHILILSILLTVSLIIGAVIGYFTARKLGDAIPEFFNKSHNAEYLEVSHAKR